MFVFEEEERNPKNTNPCPDAYTTVINLHKRGNSQPRNNKNTMIGKDEHDTLVDTQN